MEVSPLECESKSNLHRRTQMTSQTPANSTSSAGDAAAVTKTTSSNPGDSCMWYAGESCSKPRLGYDCLNVLLSTDECAIDPTGACVSMSVYEKYMADKEYYEAVQRYYPASSYSYCSASDLVCSSCIAEWTSSYSTTGTAGEKLYCTGSDGCVCVAATEVPDWEQTVVASQCDGSAISPEFSSNTQIYIVLALCIAVFALLSFYLIRRYKRLAAASGSRSTPSSEPQLKLAGWKSLREKLIETEHDRVRETANDKARSGEALAEASVLSRIDE